MSLYEDMLSYGLEVRLQTVLPRHLRRAAADMDTRCLKMLEEIKYILEDDSIDDPECFHKIEAIVRVFENQGSNCGGRHDF